MTMRGILSIERRIIGEIYVLLLCGKLICKILLTYRVVCDILNKLLGTEPVRASLLPLLQKKKCLTNSHEFGRISKSSQDGMTFEN
jgi:hypothetical protein